MDGIEHNFTDGIKLLHENLPLVINWALRFISATVIIVAGWLVGNALQRRVERIRRLDTTLTGFIGGLLKYIVLAISFITVLGQFGVQTASLLAVLGAAGLAIGLALQGTLSNVAAGAMILILRPFRAGDYIQTGAIGGTVKTLGLFGTELATPDNVYIFVPNGKIWGNEIFNYSRNAFRRQDIKVGIGYGADIGKAFTIIRDVLDKDPRVLKNDPDRPFDVMANALGESSIDLIVRFWTSNADYWAARFDITKAVKESLDAAGIDIPFPTRTLYMTQKQA
jgi:small conductance mechanosensitive channel